HRIAAVHSDGVFPVARPDAGQGRGDVGIGFVPRDLGPSGRRTPHRAPEPIGIVMELLEPVRFRADEAARERIVGVAANGDDGLALDVQRQAAGRFAKRTHAVDGPPITHAEIPPSARSDTIVTRVTLAGEQKLGNYLAGKVSRGSSSFRSSRPGREPAERYRHTAAAARSTRPAQSTHARNAR